MGHRPGERHPAQVEPERRGREAGLRQVEGQRALRRGTPFTSSSSMPPRRSTRPRAATVASAEATARATRPRSGSVSGSHSQAWRPPRPRKAPSAPSTSTTCGPRRARRPPRRGDRRAPATGGAFRRGSPGPWPRAQSPRAPRGAPGASAADRAPAAARTALPPRRRRSSRVAPARRPRGTGTPGTPREAPREALGLGDLAGDQSVAREKLLGRRCRPLGPLDRGRGALLHERPAALRGRRQGPPAPEDVPTGSDPSRAPLHRRRGVRAQHAEGVVGHQALPHQVPERLERLPGNPPPPPRGAERRSWPPWSAAPRGRPGCAR
jgi:hypothetical protein